MKKVMIGLVGLCLMVGVALADTKTVSLTVTNGQAATLSDPVSLSGYLDKIELVNSDGTTATSTVVIATYSGTTAVETFASKTLTSAAVIRPRVLPTDNTGTALSGALTHYAVASNTTNTVASTVLSVPYVMPLIGGNVKMSVAGTANDGANTVTATFYYEPLNK
jgi:hypothetical protein